MRRLIFSILLALFAHPALAQDGPLGLAAPESVTSTGLLRYILPRFSLKTGIRITPDAGGDLILREAPPGVPVFGRGETVYFLTVPDDPRAARFADWLTSEIGQRTIDAFAEDGEQLFTSAVDIVEEEVATVYDGDPVEGARVSLAHCGRCHVIGPQNAGKSIGSTPSFAVLRTLVDWEEKFLAFFALAPHPAFTQIEDVTEPFDPQRPSPIVPVLMTLDDLDAIMAYVSTVPAADLGAPLQYQ